MNLILIEESDFTTPHCITLNDRRFEHIATVHRSSPGDRVRIGQLNGLMGEAVIESLSPRQAKLRVLQLDQPPPAKLPLTIILALPRPKMARRILRTVAELGVQQLILINSYKVEKSFWQSPILKPESIRSCFLDGLQQSKDTMLPTIHLEKRFKPFVEDTLPGLIQDQDTFIAHPTATTQCPHSLTQATTLAIGPEGGFTDYEVNRFIEGGFQDIRLSERILTVENALTTLVAKLF